MTPLVSVMMPCYNARPTLPTALASLLLQTHQDWECVIVDDGSTDSTSELLETLVDERFRALRLPVNRGRGVARQIALQHARGDYLAFLDADDWWYPEKLERQLALLDRERDVAVVNTGLAVISDRGELIGVCRAPLTRVTRASSPPQTPAPQRLRRPAMAFPTCMVRMGVARTSYYDPRLHLAQDFDFFLRILRRYPSYPMPELLYAYREPAATALDKMIQTRRFERRLFWSYRAERPLEATFQLVLAAGKEATYRAGRVLGLDDYLVNRRWQCASASEAADFLQARRQVASAATRLCSLLLATQ